MNETITNILNEITTALNNINDVVTKTYDQETTYKDKDLKYHDKVKEYQDMISSLESANIALSSDISALEREKNAYDSKLDFDNSALKETAITEKKSELEKNNNKIQIIKNVLANGNDTLKPLAEDHYTETYKYITTLSNKKTDRINSIDEFNKVIKKCNALLQIEYINPVSMEQFRINQEINDIKRY